MGTYSFTKLIMIMFTIELAKRLRETRVTANAVHPGIVRTPMMLQAKGVFRVVSYLALPFSISPQKGASTSVYLASSPDVKGVSGGYFTRCQMTEVKSRFNTGENRDALWNISMKCLQQGE